MGKIQFFFKSQFLESWILLKIKFWKDEFCWKSVFGMTNYVEISCWYDVFCWKSVNGRTTLVKNKFVERRMILKIRFWKGEFCVKFSFCKEEFRWNSVLFIRCECLQFTSYLNEYRPDFFLLEKKISDQITTLAQFRNQ